MIKPLLAGAAALVAGTSAHAGIYLNGEVNQSYIGSESQGNIVDLHVGYEVKPSDNSSVYIQAGSALLNPQFGESSTEFSGKGGFDVSFSERLSGYGELSFLTVEDFDNAFNAKGGIRFNF